MTEQERTAWERPDLVYPGGLTNKDKELIFRQCERQQATSKEQVEGFAAAYAAAKALAQNHESLQSSTAIDWETRALLWATLIEAGRNKNGYRQVPAVFADGASALDWKEVPEAIKRFWELYTEEGRLEPNEAYFQFEAIHPFEDGNGRLGDLLWKLAVARKTGVWPEELPPHYEPSGRSGPYESAFGPISGSS